MVVASLFAARSEGDLRPTYRPAELEHRDRWAQLCSSFLPIRLAGTIWRASRDSKPNEPGQGWKLHISATAPQACDVFEAVAPFLASRDLRFKAPTTLTDLIELNSGLRHGYSQVGKFVTVYPQSSDDAVEIAAILDKLTRNFIAISVPFDNEYRPGSNVFYRYGRFIDQLEMKDPDGKMVAAVRNLAGDLVPDDNRIAVPDWISDPFPRSEEIDETSSPLTHTYRVFQAMTQRGKGGTYRAIDLSTTPPRLCVVKQGRRYGEMDFNGQDGFALVENEHRTINDLSGKRVDVPTLFESFEFEGNFYFAMEHIDGPNLHEVMMRRRRRFSIAQVIDYAIEAARTVEKINKAGWVWNDCKPTNLIVTKSGRFRPVDFENAHRSTERPSFNWSSRAYSSDAAFGDGFALGAMIYLLLTGKFYDRENRVPIRKLRRNVPDELISAVERLLTGRSVSITWLRKKLVSVRRQFRNSLKVRARS